jgi:ubiquinone/menaquinone biosynthesis C-methylase UbiE
MDYKAVAEQLRKPDGDFGRKIAENMNVSNHLINKYTIQNLAINAGDNILEIGMGNGFFVKDILAAKEDVKYTGCDFSETMIAEATKLNQAFVQSGQAGFILANAAKSPFADNSFDKIFSINTIYFWDNPAAQLAEIHRLLKTNGLLAIGLRPAHVMQNYPFTQFGFTLYSKADVTQLLEANNFKVKNIIEIQEPDQEIGDITVSPESLIVVAEAIK